ncbi:hypothetical protein [Vibrio scophthalmi]
MNFCAKNIESTIDSVTAEVWLNSDIAPSKRNREVVIRLHELGIF